MTADLQFNDETTAQAETTAQGPRHNRVVDLVVTITILVLLGVVAVVLLFFAVMLAMVATSCGDGCITLFEIGWFIAMGSVVLGPLVALVWAIVLLVRKRRAWVVTLIIAGSTLVAWVLGVAIVFFAANS